jgi:hypothetical protein
LSGFFTRLKNLKFLNFPFPHFYGGFRASASFYYCRIIQTIQTKRKITMKTKSLMAAMLIVSALLSVNNSSAQSWNVTGNAATNPTTQFLGTTDAKDFKIRTNNVVRMTFKNTGKIGIGTAAPTAVLHLEKSTLTDLLVKSSGAGAQLTVDRAANGFEAVTRYMQTGVPQWKTGLTVNATGTPEYVIANEINGNNALTISSNNLVNLPAGSLSLGTTNTSTLFKSGDDVNLSAFTPTTASGLNPGNVILSHTTLLGFKSGNVGIGTNDVSLGKLVVQGAAGNTVGLFRRNSTSAGVSIIGDWPGIYFNSYFNGTQKAMSPGYSGLVNFDPVNGKIIIGSSATSAGAAGDAVSVPEALVINASGNVGIGTSTPNYKLHVVSSTFDQPILGESTYINGNGVVGVANASFSSYGVWGSSSSGYAGNFTGNLHYTGTLTGPSDIRLKANIKPLTGALENVMKVETKTYNYKTEEFKSMNLSKGNQFGFIAQQLETVYPDLVKAAAEKNDKGEVTFEYKSVNYIGMIPILTAAIQELKTSLDEKNNEIDQLKNRLNHLENSTPSCNQCPNKNSQTLNFSKEAMLGQNVPNPFTEKTEIAYYIPSSASQGTIRIFDNTGKEVKSLIINTKGAGKFELSLGTLQAGIYSYSLTVDGKSVDVKQMIVK